MAFSLNSHELTQLFITSIIITRHRFPGLAFFSKCFTGVNMKKKTSLLLCLVAAALLFSACPKNSKLAQNKQKKTPAKQESKTVIDHERIKEKLSEEIAEMRERREAHEKYDQPREAAEFYKLKRVPVGETEIPVEKYLQAKEQMREMRQYSSAENRFLPSRTEMERSPQLEANSEALGNWTPLGPGNIGGRTRTLIIHPTGTNVMYAGGVAGGVWKTTNGGASWAPVGDLLPNIAVSALAFDPANPNIIYAGTGEGYYNGDGLRGAGFFKTVDAGVNWTRIASTDTPDFYYVNDIIVSHNNSNNIYVATKTGIWRSLNGGASWENVLIASGGLGCTDCNFSFESQCSLCRCVNVCARKLSVWIASGLAFNFQWRFWHVGNAGEQF